jgi:precorrin-6A/cobalt-precorrin-6A reductase
MSEAVVFAGTSEGRRICEYLVDCGASVHMCVATEYGKEIARSNTNIGIHTGIMDADEMRKFFKSCDFVVDATHPYARQVTKNIKYACGETGKPYYRLLRAMGDSQGCIVVDDAQQAAEYLRDKKGNVLLTTGSKDLMAYKGLDVARLYPRVLPVTESFKRCRALGVPQKNIICMQGLFSLQMNKATLKHVQAKFLVTKNSGNAGGYREKLDAAKQEGVTVIVIGRPMAETGYTMEQLKQILAEQEGIK